jgi:hypothetical protein
MKKLVCAACAAILACGFVFAEDAAAKTELPAVKVTGGLMSGFAVNKDGSNDATISAWNTDIGAAARAYLNFDITGDNYGFSAQLRGQASQLKGTATSTTKSDLTTTTVFGYGLDMPYFKWIYGYADLFKNVLPVTVKGGFLYEDIWGVGYEPLSGTYGYTSGPAVVVDIKPIQLKGLEFGAFIGDFGTSGWSDVKLSSDNLTVGAKYTLENVFAVGAQYKFGKGSDAWSGDAYTGGAFMGSASLNCVKNLTLNAEGEIRSITTSNPYYLYDEYAAYNFTDKISADLIAMQFVSDKIYTFEPSVTYTLTDNVSFKLIGGDFISFASDTTANDWFVMPGVTLKAGKAKVDLSYAYATSGAPKGGYNYYYYKAGSNIMLNYKFTF